MKNVNYFLTCTCSILSQYLSVSISFCRNQVESCNVEKEKLLENANNLVNEKSVLIQESEDSTRQLEQQYEIKLK